MILESEFDSAMEALYYHAGRDAGYWANYFNRDLRQLGGLATAKRLLKPRRGSSVHKGFQALIDAGMTHISVEQLVLTARFRGLFTPDEIAEAERRLATIPAHAVRERVPAARNHPETLSERREYFEGAVRQVLVNVFERDPIARDACLKRHGFRCAVCNMSFKERYGDIGEGFIHVHHKKPLAACRAAYRIDPVKDLVPVCPNCHAMLHTSDPPLYVEELREKLAARATKQKGRPRTTRCT
jgi:5-methylcytosine-specific restriction protein A